MLSNGFHVILGVAPAAKATAIVSPIAREIARIKEAKTPDKAAGKTILVVTSNCVAPTAYAAWRRFLGTARKASSQREAIIGKIIIPTTIEADAALKTRVDGKIFCSAGVT